MKAVLIFPAFSVDLPTYIPFGISSLKSYIESNSKHRIKCFDFNQDFFFRALADTDVLDVCSYCKREKASCARFGKRIKLEADLQIRKNLPHLLYLLKDKDIYYKLKCKIWESISEYYADYITCMLEIMGVNIKDNAYGKFDKIFRYYIDKAIFQRPDIIGFSVFSYSQAAFSVVLAKLLRENGFSKKIVFGGHIVSITPTEKRQEFLRKYNFIDFLIEKEGEPALLGLLNGIPREKIPNLIYLENDVIKTNKLDNGFSDINRLPPPDYSDFDIDKYILPGKVLLLSTSRNCPWNKCIFCGAYLSFNKGFRQKEPGLVIQDIKTLVKKYGVNIFFFIDPCITVDYIRKIIREIRKAGLEINYGLFMRLEEEFKDEKFIAQLYESGCRYIQFGVETLIPRVAKKINKGINVGSVEKILINCKKNNIYCHITAIFGLPTQSEKDIKSEIRKYSRLSDNTDFTFEANILSVMPGTIIYENFKRYDMRLKKENLSSFKYYPFKQLVYESKYQSACVSLRSLHKLFLRANKKINKDRTFNAVCRDDMFLTAINAYRTKPAPLSASLK